MVSTPIPAPASPIKASPVYAQAQYSSSIPLDISSQNHAPNQHSFPVLYTTSPMGTSKTTEATPSPISLYSEYIGNPYTLPNNAFSVYGSQPFLVYQQEQTETSTENSNSDKNDTETVPANIFQSSNYFYTDPNTANIPVGSEILFGTNTKTT